MARSYEQVCPVARTLDVVGDRWTLLIIRDLFFGQRRFSDFLRRSPRLPTRVLSERLKRLEEHGLIERQIYRQHPPRADYRLTGKGRSLRPVLRAIAEWGMEHRLDPSERALVPRALPE